VQPPGPGTDRAISTAHQSPVSNASRVRWKRRKGHLPGRTFEGDVFASQEYLRKLKMANSKPPKEKASASQCLTVKRIWGDKHPSTRSSRRSRHPTHPEQSGLVAPGAEEQQQSNTSNSPYPSER